MLADVGGDHLTVLRRGVVENPLDEVVAVLVARDIDQGDPGSIAAALANSVQVSAKKVSATDLEALLDDL